MNRSLVALFVVVWVAVVVVLYMSAGCSVDAPC